ncbi:MAG: hypothetical protein ACRCWR_04690 [Saezia sp.]
MSTNRFVFNKPAATSDVWENKTPFAPSEKGKSKQPADNVRINIMRRIETIRELQALGFSREEISEQLPLKNEVG